MPGEDLNGAAFGALMKKVQQIKDWHGFCCGSFIYMLDIYIYTYDS